MGVVGEIMTGAELTRWAAFEQVAGPILVHDRIDFGLAQLSYINARAAGSKAHLKDFLPAWQRNQPSDVKDAFEQLLRMADAAH